MKLPYHISRRWHAIALMTVMTAIGATRAGAQETAMALPAPQPQAADTVATASEEIPEFSRNITQLTFIPKGQWITGVSVSYSQTHLNNYTFFVLENLNGDTYTFKVSPMLLYSFKDNLAAGGRFAYSRSRTQIDTAYLNLGEDTNADIENLYNITHDFSVAGVFRNYLSLGNSLRFGFFNEVQVQLGGGQSKIINGRGQSLSGTYSTNFNLSVGLQPGMIVFLSNYSALEVNVGVLGFSYRHSSMKTDQIYDASFNTKSANFRINLFSITFGAVFYL